MAVVGIMAYVGIILLNGSDISSMIAVLGAFAMALIKLMPSAAGISSYVNTLTYLAPSVEEVEEVLLSESEEKSSFTDIKGDLQFNFNDRIEMQGICFKYSNRNQVIFDNANMTIEKGKSIGIKGASGAGKTTIVDILLGLLEPDNGRILIDGKESTYQSFRGGANVGYIPQNIFLMDDTLRRNVAFGIKDSDIDDDRVLRALGEAQMLEYVMSLPKGLDTIVGEHGVRFSGGQRQRIGIARALYHDPVIMVFDEATSALDEDTERAVMDAVESMHGKKTLIIIAHRLKTIEKCDVIYTVEGGKIKLQ